jgi:hypothetical protein
MASGLGVGGAAAQGIASGFQMGREVSNDADRRAQLARENARQDMLDAQRTAQINRSNTEQDTHDANAEQDRAYQGVQAEMEDNRIALASLVQQYGSADKVPQSQVDPLIAQARDIASRRGAILNARQAPYVQQEQQWAQNISSRVATGQMSADDLSPADLVRWVQASTRRPITDFQRNAQGVSVVGQAVKDMTAGIQTNNGGLTTQGAGVLMAPDLNVANGGVSPDGGIIVNKSLAALVPAPQAPGTAPPGPSPLVGLGAALASATTPPAAGGGATPAPGLSGANAAASTAAPSAGPVPPTGSGASQAADPNAPPDSAPAAAPQTPMQALSSPSLLPPAPSPAPAPPPPPLTPGTDPNRVLPVLQVTAEHPDGTQVTYNAPVTVGRSSDPDATIHPGLNISDGMQRMGQLGTLETWINTPAAQAKIAQGTADLGGNINDFTTAYAAMHGDPKALLPVGSTDPTTLKIQAYTKAAAAAGVPLADYVRMIEGRGATGLQAKLDAIDASDLSDADKTKAKQIAAGLVKVATPKTGGTGLGGAATPNNTLTGDDLLAAQSPSDQAIIKGLIDGTIKPETLSVRNNHRENMVGIAARVANGRGDGSTMNTSTAAVNTGTEKAFTTGKPAQTIRAMNTAVDHLATLGQLATALGNGDVNALNNLKNKVSNQFGNVDVSNFDAAKQIVADEVVKAVVASGGSIGGALADRDKAEAQVNNAKSPAQLAGVIGTFTKLMGGQINSLGQQYVSGGGAKDFTSFLTPATKALYRGPQPKNIGGGLGGTGAISTPGSFVEGQVYKDASGNQARYSGGKWVPL